MQVRESKIMKFIRRLAIDVEPMANSKIAAGIIIKGQIISVGHNKNRTHPLQAKYGRNKESIYLHAELAAIINALNHLNKDDLKHATLFVHRVKRPCSNSTDWVDGMAKPCSGCMSAISAFNIKKVIYSTNTQGNYEIINRYRCD